MISSVSGAFICQEMCINFDFLTVQYSNTSRRFTSIEVKKMFKEIQDKRSVVKFPKVLATNYRRVKVL